MQTVENAATSAAGRVTPASADAYAGCSAIYHGDGSRTVLDDACSVKVAQAAAPVQQQYVVSPAALDGIRPDVSTTACMFCASAHHYEPPAATVGVFGVGVPVALFIAMLCVIGCRFMRREQRHEAPAEAVQPVRRAAASRQSGRVSLALLLRMVWLVALAAIWWGGGFYVLDRTGLVLSESASFALYLVFAISYLIVALCVPELLRTWIDRCVERNRIPGWLL